eukprot:3628451-Prymnesium_polylepis.1
MSSRERRRSLSAAAPLSSRGGGPAPLARPEPTAPLARPEPTAALARPEPTAPLAHSSARSPVEPGMAPKTANSGRSGSGMLSGVELREEPARWRLDKPADSW